jgi:hypothetical protein
MGQWVNRFLNWLIDSLGHWIVEKLFRLSGQRKPASEPSPSRRSPKDGDLRYQLRCSQSQRRFYIAVPAFPFGRSQTAKISGLGQPVVAMHLIA